MAKLQYLDLDNITLKDIANIDSPSLEGTPVTVNPIDENNNQIINFRYLKRQLDKAIKSFNIESAESFNNALTELVPGADYMIHLYGINTLTCDPNFPYHVIWADKYPDSYVFINTADKIFIDDPDDPLPKGYVRVGYFALVDKAGNILGRTALKPRAIDWPNGSAGFPESASIKITAPVDGFVYGYLNYGISFAVPIPVKHMTAIRINDKKIDTYKASIVQQDNQTIIVTANGIDYKENFTAEPGTHFTTRSEGYPGYKGGTVNPSEGVIEDNVIFTVSPATPTTYTCTIEQKPHQTITVTYNGRDYTEERITGLPLNAVLVARITSVDYGYAAGTLNMTTFKVKSDVVVTSTDPIPMPYTVTIEQKENELIRVWYGDRIYTETFVAGYLDDITVVVQSLNVSEYLPGEVLMSGNYSETEVYHQYKILGDVTVSAYSARRKLFMMAASETGGEG